MKLNEFCRQGISVALFAFASTAFACGPYAPIIPTPDFFALSGAEIPLEHYNREENIRLWQELTDRSIPAADVEQAVYRDPLDTFNERTLIANTNSGNLFYTYINNTNDNEIIDFLSTAKRLEKERSAMRSPWYYPRERNCMTPSADFADIIKIAKEYRGTRLADRYALQITHALFASRQYAACLEHVDTAFASVPLSNLMKRMALNYAAGCYSHIGDNERADSLFAEAGDIYSLSVDDPVSYMAARNPAAPQVMDYIRHHAADTSFMLNVAPIARRVVADSRVRAKGEWYYLMSYIDGEFSGNQSRARANIAKAIGQQFADPQMHRLARAYSMKLNARAGTTSTLLPDLQWLEGLTDARREDCNEWIRVCRNIIYVDWIPHLWRKHDYATAILLCAYADFLGPSQQKHDGWFDLRVHFYRYPTESLSLGEMRDSEKFINRTDYGSLSFQLMESLTSAQLSAAYLAMQNPSPLRDFLWRKSRHDRDYYYELIGTLALREGHYERAVNYLSQVSDHYVRTTNVYKCGYLTRNPFGEYIFDKEYPAGYHSRVVQDISEGTSSNAKLNFALNMQKYGRQMHNCSTADARGLARVVYAIGRRNSFDDCWALTQYSRGWVGLFEPELDYWVSDFAPRNYAFLRNYSSDDCYSKVEQQYQAEVEAALAMLTTDEARAEAQYMLGNLKTIARRYPETTIGQYLRTACDHWSLWL